MHDLPDVHFHLFIWLFSPAAVSPDKEARFEFLQTLSTSPEYLNLVKFCYEHYVSKTSQESV
jgi:hypothetical protein